MCSSDWRARVMRAGAGPWENPAHFDAEPTRSPPCRLYARLVQAELRERASLLDTALCLGGADVDVLCDALLALAEKAGIDGLLEGTPAWRAMLRCAATCCTVSQRVGLCCNMVHCVATWRSRPQRADRRRVCCRCRRAPLLEWPTPPPQPLAVTHMLREGRLRV